MAAKLNNFKDLWKLVQSFDLSRAPAGMRNEHKILSELVKHYRMYEISPPDPAFLKKLEQWHIEWFNRQDIDKMKTKFSPTEDEPTTVDGKHATYTKDFPGSYKKFQDSIKHLETFLASLNGIHGKSKANLKVRFTNRLALGLSYVGEYDRKLDEIRINPAKLATGANIYGSANYVILHELGHRFLAKHPQSFKINDDKWITTDYSKKPAPPFNEEKFAELFALSNWPAKFPLYQTTIKDWLKQVK